MKEKLQIVEEHKLSRWCSSSSILNPVSLAKLLKLC